MTNKENFEKVSEILSVILKIPKEKILPESALVDDLGLDSVDFIEIYAKLNEIKSKKIKEEEIVKLKTVNDVIKLLEK